MYCWAWESPSTTMRFFTVSGLLFCRQPLSSGSLGTLPSVHSPSMSAHSFFMAAGAGMTVASAHAGYTFGFWLLMGAGVLLFLIAPLIQRLMHGVK